MTLQLQGHSYRYAVEQTVMALLPQVKIQQVLLPEDPPPALSQEDNFLVSSLVTEKHTGKGLAKTSLRIQGTTHTSEISYDLPPLQDKTPDQYALKQSLYLAILPFLPTPPPWGSLTGVRPGKMARKWLKELGEEADIPTFFQETFHLSPQRSQLVDRCGRTSLALEKKLPPNAVSLYISIPFCPTRCSYCSFFSADIRQNQALVPLYLQGLQEELTQVAALLQAESIPITTLYLGGGTPTVLTAPQLRQLLSHISQALPVENLWEYTVEAGRPDTLDQEKLHILQDFGVNRISINPQTMSDSILSHLGRGHTVQDIFQVYHQAQGRFSINMDLIAGLPGETLPSFTASLSKVLDLAPQQITLHTLTPKRASPLLQELDQLPQESLVESMLLHTWSTLPGRNFQPYYVYRQKKIAGGFENIGWCQPKEEGLYNIIMMEELQTVLALGAGGMSKTVSPEGAITRLNSPKFPKEYLDKLPQIIEKKQALIRNPKQTKKKENPHETP